MLDLICPLGEQLKTKRFCPPILCCWIWFFGCRHISSANETQGFRSLPPPTGATDATYCCWWLSIFRQILLFFLPGF